MGDGGSDETKRDQWNWAVSVLEAQSFYRRALEARQTRKYDSARDLVRDSIETLGRLPEQSRSPESLQLLRHLDKLACDLQMKSTGFDLWSRGRKIRIEINASQLSSWVPALVAEMKVPDEKSGGGLAQDRLLVPEVFAVGGPEETTVSNEIASGAVNAEELDDSSRTSARSGDPSAPNEMDGVHSGLEAALAAAGHELSNGQPENAAVLLEEALKATSANSDPGDPLRVQAEVDLAKIQLARGYLEQARLLLEQVLANMELNGGGDEQQREDALGALADTLLAQGDYSGARDVQEALYESCSKHLDEGDPGRIALGDRLVAAYAAAGDFDLARALGEVLLILIQSNNSLSNNSLSKSDPRIGERHLQLARLAELSGDLPGSLSHLERYIRDFLGKGESGGSDQFSVHGDMARVLEEMGQHGRAGYHLDRYLEWLDSQSPMWAKERDNTRESGARVAEKAGDLVSAQDRLEALLGEYQKRFSPDHPRIQSSRQSLARVLAKQGDTRRAEALQAEVCGVLAQTLPANDPSLGLARSAWIALMVEIEDVDGALRELRELLMSTPSSRAANMSLAQMRLHAAQLQRDCQHLEAIAMREAIVDQGRAIFFPGHPILVEDTRELAALLRTSGHAADARVVERRIEGYPAIPGTLGEHWGEALEAASGTFVDAIPVPRVMLSEPVVTESGEVQFEAMIQDSAGIRDWTVFQDGLERNAIDKSTEWTWKSEGTEGLLRFTLPMPSDAAVTLVEVSASNFDGLRGLGRTVVTSPLLP